MKYVVVLCDGMADNPVEELKGKTPMMIAEKPNMDYFARLGEVGLVKTVPNGMKPGSDVANLSVMGYDPEEYYTGRSPLEAVSIGIDMLPSDVAFRCNLVTLSDDGSYDQRVMIDYCADDISSEEAAEIIKTVEAHLGNESFTFYSGVSYRHCMIWRSGKTEVGFLTPPHDISGRVITEYLDQNPEAAPLIRMMRDSYALLKDHPVNQARIARGKRPANSIWLWGQGKKPSLIAFKDKFGKSGAVVSAVDLLKGIGKCANMVVPDVKGATGYIDTNWGGKVDAALQVLKNGGDFVYIHLEAPDECGHRGEVANKVKSIELIDEKVLFPLALGLKRLGEYRIMILPDHPTPLDTRTHSSEPVPYLIFDSTVAQSSSVTNFNEVTAKNTGIFRDNGSSMMQYFLNKG